MNGDVRSSRKSLAMFPQVLRSFPDFGCAPPSLCFPGGEPGESMALSAAEYILSAVMGVIVSIGLLYVIGKRIARD